MIAHPPSPLHPVGSRRSLLSSSTFGDTSVFPLGNVAARLASRLAAARGHQGSDEHSRQAETIKQFHRNMCVYTSMYIQAHAYLHMHIPTYLRRAYVHTFVLRTYMRMVGLLATYSVRSGTAGRRAGCQGCNPKSRDETSKDLHIDTCGSSRRRRRRLWRGRYRRARSTMRFDALFHLPISFSPWIACFLRTWLPQTDISRLTSRSTPFCGSLGQTQRDPLAPRAFFGGRWSTDSLY